VPPPTAARSAVIADTMLPAAPVTTTTLSASSVIPAPAGMLPSSVRAGNACRLMATPHRPSSARPISTAPGSRRVSSTSRSAMAAVLRLAGTSTALTSACCFSFLYDLAKPVTAPPMGAVAPAGS